MSEWLHSVIYCMLTVSVLKVRVNTTVLQPVCHQTHVIETVVRQSALGNLGYSG